MDDLRIASLNLNKVCRVCLIECENMYSIYSELFEENSNVIIPRIHEILNVISSIKVVFLNISNRIENFINYL